MLVYTPIVLLRTHTPKVPFSQDGPGHPWEAISPYRNDLILDGQRFIHLHLKTPTGKAWPHFHPPSSSWPFRVERLVWLSTACWRPASQICNHSGDNLLIYTICTRQTTAFKMSTQLKQQLSKSLKHSYKIVSMGYKCHIHAYIHSLLRCNAQWSLLLPFNNTTNLCQWTNYSRNCNLKKIRSLCKDLYIPFYKMTLCLY